MKYWLLKDVKVLSKKAAREGRVEVTGNIGKDGVDFKVLEPSGKKVANFSVAENIEGQEKPTWHKVQVWAGEAEKIKDLKQGDFVEVKGKASTEEWKTEAGEERSREIVTGYEVNTLSLAQDRAEKVEAVQDGSLAEAIYHSSLDKIDELTKGKDDIGNEALDVLYDDKMKSEGTHTKEEFVDITNIIKKNTGLEIAVPENDKFKYQTQSEKIETMGKAYEEPKEKKSEMKM